MGTLKRPPIVAPLVPLAAAFAAGIVVAHEITFPLFVWAVVGCLLLLCGFVIAPIRRWCVLLSMAALGGANAQLYESTPHIPTSEAITATIEVCNHSRLSKWSDWQCDADIIEWNREGETPTRSNRHLKVSYKTEKPYPAGTQLRGRLKVKPFEQNGFGRVMSARGFEGYAHIDEPQTIGKRNSLRYRAQQLQQTFVERIGLLGLTADDSAVAEAMITGYRQDITSDVRNDYSATGSSHLLAVSGLHIGIVFLLINLLLAALPLIRYGHLIRNIVAIALIWLFTLISGLSPSAIRAAIMFSTIQVGLLFTAHRTAINTLCGAGLIMLVIDPGYLYDISFQLSMTAVAGILLWHEPLYGFIHSESRVLNAIWSVIIIGFCATIAITPLAAYTFGRVSLLGIVLGPVLVALAHVTILVGMVWCLLPFGFMRGVASAILQWSVGAQNGIIGSSAEVPFSAIDWTPSGFVTILIYIGYAAATVLLLRTTQPHSPTIHFE